MTAALPQKNVLFGRSGTSLEKFIAGGFILSYRNIKDFHEIKLQLPG